MLAKEYYQLNQSVRNQNIIFSFSGYVSERLLFSMADTPLFMPAGLTSGGASFLLWHAPRAARVCQALFFTGEPSGIIYDESRKYQNQPESVVLPKA